MGMKPGFAVHFCALILCVAAFPFVTGSKGCGGGSANVSESSQSLKAEALATYSISQKQDEGTGIAIDSEGRLVVAGTTWEEGKWPRMTIWRYTSDGTLESMFGAKSYDFSNKVSYETSAGQDLAIDSDGNMLVVGNVGGPAYSSSGGLKYLALWKFSSAGQLVSDFGDNGKVLFETSDVTGPAKIALDGSGKALLLGNQNDATSFAVIRYKLSDGSIDTGFGGGSGFVGKAAYGRDIAVDGSGGIYVVADCTPQDFDSTMPDYADMCLWKFSQTGNLDTSFGAGNGNVLYDNVAGGNGEDKGLALAVDSEGKIVVAGGSAKGKINVTDSGYGTDTEMVVWRFNSNGTLDSTFGASGIALFDGIAGGNEVENSDEANAVTLDPTSLKIYVAGGSSTTESGKTAMFVGRLKSNGSLDTTFGDGAGFVVRHNTAGGDRLDSSADMVRASNGNIYVTGYSEGKNGEDYYPIMAIWKFKPNG